MISKRTTLFKSLSIAVTLVGLMILSQGQARADEVTISGSTNGIVTGVPQLIFVGNTFTNTTVLGIGSLSGANHLGNFFLNTSPTQLVAGSFTLNITFTSPTNITGGQGTIYTATVTGSVSPNVNQGGVNINFNNTPVVFTFASQNGTTGSFTVALADLFVETGQQAPITAGTTGSQTSIPEPATLVLLGSGLTGIAAKLRRRKKPSESKV